MPRVVFTPERAHIELRGVHRKSMKNGPSRIFQWKTATKTGVTRAGPGVDISLDDIIKARGRGQARGARGARGRMPGTAKLIISNLDQAVSDTDLQALFGDLGDLESAVLHYDKQGKSLGTAHVMFARRIDAVKGKEKMITLFFME